MASNLIQPISGDSPQILNIAQSRVVDDEATIDGVQSQTRFFNIVTTETRQELTVYDVFEQCPQFIPGYTIGKVPNRRRLSNVRLRETEATAVYELECEFAPFEFKTPFLVPVDWTWETTTIEIPAYTDNKGKAIVTTAGEPITGLTRPLKCWILTGTRNVPGVPDWFRDVGVSMNAKDIKLDGETFKKKTLQLQRVSLGSYTSQTINKTEYRYRPLSFEFWFNPFTWTTEVLNLGFNELQVRRFPITDSDGNATGKFRTVGFPVRATDAKGEETKQRVFLDKAGQRPRDAQNNIKTQLAPEEIVTLKFDILEELDYAPLLK